MQAWNLGYEAAKKKAKEIYSKVGRIPCPAFNGELVAFNSKGFDHILRKGRIPRTRNEQKRRFVLIQYAERIVKNPKATILFEQRELKFEVDRHGEKVLLTSVAQFWTFVDKVGDCQVKVVIQQLGVGKQKYFLSIMGDNVQITKRSNSKQKTRL